MKCEKAVKQAHQDLLKLAQHFLNKSEETLGNIDSLGSFSVSDLSQLESIQHFAKHANRQMDQIKRRVLQGEIIPHDEKVLAL